MNGLEIPPQYGYPLLTAVALAIIGGVIRFILRNRPGAPSLPEMWEEIRKLKVEQENSSRRELVALTAAGDARSEARELKNFIADWMNRLAEWDTGGRKGRIPLPSGDDMRRLHIQSDEALPEAP